MADVVTFLVPVYNEARTILEVIERATALHYHKEIIVIDDGSTDGTRTLLRQRSDIRVLSLDRNSGRGAALRAGIEIATGDIIAFMDGDMEVAPSVYESLIDPILANHTDVVIGSRFLSGASSRMSVPQRYGNRSLTVLANVLYRTRLTDVESGTAAFRADVLRSLRLSSAGWSLSIETAAQLSRRRARLLEVPIHYVPRSIEAGKKLRWADYFTAVYFVFKYAFLR
jgi:glycosyltransferase involved in cell wall biosynthesis